MNRSRALASILIIILSILLLIGLVWGNHHFIKNVTIGEGFLIQWISIRSLITSGISPYNGTITTQIQTTTISENSFAPVNVPRYTSPLYSGVVVFPFALIKDQKLAHSLWSTGQFIAIFIMLISGLRLTAWKPLWYIFMLFSFVTILSYHATIPWMDGGLSIWAAVFLVFALLAIYNNRNELAGILLAFATIQPLMVILPVVFTIIWAAAHRRRLLILWFFITLIFLSIIGLFIVPDWILEYIKILYKFPQNFPPGSPMALLTNNLPGLGKQLGWLVIGISGIVLLIEWWQAAKKDFRWFLWTICLTLVISQWTGIPTIPANFIGLIPVIVLISAMLSERWPRAGQWVALLGPIIILVWEWALYYYDLTSAEPGMQLNLIIPLPLVTLLGLYWVRWWAIKPRRLLIEELKLGEIY